MEKPSPRTRVGLGRRQVPFLELTESFPERPARTLGARSGRILCHAQGIGRKRVFLKL